MIHRPDLSVALDILIQTVLDVVRTYEVEGVTHTKTTTTEEKKTTSSCPGQQTRDDGPDSSAQSPKRPAIFFLFLFDPAHHRNLRPTFYFAKFFFFFWVSFRLPPFLCVCVCVCASRNDFPSPKVQCAGGQRVLANNSIRSANNGNAKMHRGKKRSNPEID
jgi:hypothetical protein